MIGNSSTIMTSEQPSENSVDGTTGGGRKREEEGEDEGGRGSKYQRMGGSLPSFFRMMRQRPSQLRKG
ncbi:hypothetical protein HPP92_012458 [Vanilla planifolia]|uniref:Uncharacterized protein n=1 Tax=Vanilla planifolia TaxID=51239 RepID=A0A835QS59_VANPL|nr:hypothetical protein HPP92_012458 [Vanilla planifolia]